MNTISQTELDIFKHKIYETIHSHLEEYYNETETTKPNNNDYELQIIEYVNTVYDACMKDPELYSCYEETPDFNTWGNDWFCEFVHGHLPDFYEKYEF